ncbi:YtpI family protein [Paenibacillus beijingensis]|uniref:YtpI-like protein n=1 Tax=Paenibacillus beijingensis TaxID=1126833 RepID=A0A0D5NLF8_9BACL|nr:YtpI family protein [Paenibacillus beijingensis]AJY75985.1 hypothetical protein VN24_17280 [Paenibacillus beijingensis]
MSAPQIIQWVLIAGICVTSVLSVYFSFKSRRAAGYRDKGAAAAKMNVSMGFMLLLIAFIQMFLFTASSIRVVVGAVFMLLGLFNIFAGLRSLSAFRGIKD